ncbi:MAG: flavodoxin family protein [Spirochaetales bacterium]|nr:flavodoxin family protein [Spirochaetales bacterium]
MKEQKPKKILAVNGSPRRAATRKALDIALEEIAAKGIEYDILDFHKMEFSLCVDCGGCLKKRSRECIRFKDDLTGWSTKFPDYDGYLIASPVYDRNVSAQLLAFFNRMRSNWIFLEKNPWLFADKTGASIAVGGSRYGGQELTLDAINNYFMSIGVKVITGGPFANNGAGVWSNDKGAEGVLEDHEGLKSLKALGLSLARSLST